jgi:hypothetical protein
MHPPSPSNKKHPIRHTRMHAIHLVIRLKHLIGCRSGHSIVEIAAGAIADTIGIARGRVDTDGLWAAAVEEAVVERLSNKPLKVNKPVPEGVEKQQGGGGGGNEKKKRGSEQTKTLH